MSCLVFFAGISTLCAEDPPQDIIESLKSDEFKVREQAQAELLEWARKDADARTMIIYNQARNAQDPEVRLRAHGILRSLAMDVYLQEGEGFLGIQMIEVRAEVPVVDGVEERQVVGITRVLRGTPAHDAELRVGDMITAVNGQRLDPRIALDSFQTKIRQIKPGTNTRFDILRDQEMIEIEVELGRRPPDQNARFFGQRFLGLNELAERDQDRFFKEWLEKLQN